MKKSCPQCRHIALDPTDRFCQVCGHALGVDQSEYVRSPQLAGITNRGLWHSKNEDAIAIECLENGWTLMVVCDGVSSSIKPETASEVAASATARALQETVLNQSPQAAIAQAIQQAQLAVSDLASLGPENPPSTTIVAALVEPDCPQPQATIGWLGDSRAYWISPKEAKLLTEDDSWINWIRNHGQTPLDQQWDHSVNSAQSLQSKYAHAITRWLGAKRSTSQIHCSNSDPSIVQVPLDSEGFLILCSDGLWNYASQPDRLLDVMGEDAQQNSPVDALTIAQHLVDHALVCGGRDNVSVTVFRQSCC